MLWTRSHFLQEIWRKKQDLQKLTNKEIYFTLQADKTKLKYFKLFQFDDQTL